jgi:nitroreductase
MTARKAPVPLEIQAPVLTPEQLIAVQHRRYATKRYDETRKIPADLWDAIEESLVYSASSTGLQPWKFLVITDPDLREKLLPVSWNQRIVTTASHLVVLAARETLGEEDARRHAENFAAVRGLGEKEKSEFLERQVGILARPGLDHFRYASLQVYLALGNLLTSAALLGLDSTAIGGFDPDAYDELLGLKGSGYRSVVAASVGYHAADDANATAPKVRFAREELIKHY